MGKIGKSKLDLLWILMWIGMVALTEELISSTSLWYLLGPKPSSLYAPVTFLNLSSDSAGV